MPNITCANDGCQNQGEVCHHRTGCGCKIFLCRSCSSLESRNQDLLRLGRALAAAEEAGVELRAASRQIDEYFRIEAERRGIEED